MKTRIREMSLIDIPKIVKYDLLVLGETLGEETLSNHLTEGFLMKYFIMENTENYDFVGMLSLWLDEDKSQINNFYIIPQYRNQKFGRQFIVYILDYLRSFSVREITLEVRASNKIAISLYESIGFKNVAIRKNYYSNGEDAYLMYLRMGSD